MPIPAPPLRVGDRGDAVARLHRTLEAIKRASTRTSGTCASSAARPRSCSAISRSRAPSRDGRVRHRHALPVTRILADIGPFTVYGMVIDADARPIAGAALVAMDVDLRRCEELAGDDRQRRGVRGALRRELPTPAHRRRRPPAAWTHTCLNDLVCAGQAPL
jgi:hypothetical protein